MAQSDDEEGVTVTYGRKEESDTDDNHSEKSLERVRRSRTVKQKKENVKKDKQHEKDISIDVQQTQSLVATNVFDTSLFSLDLDKIMPYVVLRNGNLYYRNVVPEPAMENYSFN